jgi:hypothetical protein
MKSTGTGAVRACVLSSTGLKSGLLKGQTPDVIGLNWQQLQTLSVITSGV